MGPEEPVVVAHEVLLGHRDLFQRGQSTLIYGVSSIRR